MSRSKIYFVCALLVVAAFVITLWHLAAHEREPHGSWDVILREENAPHAIARPTRSFGETFHAEICALPQLPLLGLARGELALAVPEQVQAGLTFDAPLVIGAAGEGVRHVEFTIASIARCFEVIEVVSHGGLSVDYLIRNSGQGPWSYQCLDLDLKANSSGESQGAEEVCIATIRLRAREGEVVMSGSIKVNPLPHPDSGFHVGCDEKDILVELSSGRVWKPSFRPATIRIIRNRPLQQEDK